MTKPVRQVEFRLPVDLEGAQFAADTFREMQVIYSTQMDVPEYATFVKLASNPQATMHDYVHATRAALITGERLENRTPDLKAVEDVVAFIAYWHWVQQCINTGAVKQVDMPAGYQEQQEVTSFTDHGMCYHLFGPLDPNFVRLGAESERDLRHAAQQMTTSNPSAREFLRMDQSLPIQAKIDQARAMCTDRSAKMPIPPSVIETGLALLRYRYWTLQQTPNIALPDLSANLPVYQATTPLRS